MVTDIGGGAQYSYAAIYIWNMLVRLGLFLIIAVLLGNFKELLVVEAAAAAVAPIPAFLINSRLFIIPS